MVFGSEQSKAAYMVNTVSPPLHCLKRDQRQLDFQDQLFLFITPKCEFLRVTSPVAIAGAKFGHHRSNDMSKVITFDGAAHGGRVGCGRRAQVAARISSCREYLYRRITGPGIFFGLSDKLSHADSFNTAALVFDDRFLFS